MTTWLWIAAKEKTRAGPRWTQPHRVLLPTHLAPVELGARLSGLELHAIARRPEEDVARASCGHPLARWTKGDLELRVVAISTWGAEALTTRLWPGAVRRTRAARSPSWTPCGSCTAGALGRRLLSTLT